MEHYEIPKNSHVHLVEHYCGHYWGSCSFMLDLAALLASPERIIIITHKDLSPADFGDLMRQRFLQLGKQPDHIGRVICSDGDGIYAQLSNQEMGLYPGMELIALVDTSCLSECLKYIFNTGVDLAKWISIVAFVQCGFKKSLFQILSRECMIGSCLTTGNIETYVHTPNEKPYSLLTKKDVIFKRGSLGFQISKTSPIIDANMPSREVVNILST